MKRSNPSSMSSAPEAQSRHSIAPLLRPMGWYLVAVVVGSGKFKGTRQRSPEMFVGDWIVAPVDRAHASWV